MKFLDEEIPESILVAAAVANLKLSPAISQERLDKSHDIIVIRDDNKDEQPVDAEAAYLSSITSFYCNKCGVKFDKFWKLHEHIFNSDDHLFSCSQCFSHVGYTIGEVISHVREVCGWSAFNLEEARLKTPTFRYYCDKCGKGFETFRDFEPHYFTHTAGLINCICCNFKPGSVQILLNHLKHHFVAGNIELDCQVCSLQFHALYPYQQHYFIVHSQLANIPFKCCICSEVIFDDEDKFTWHLQKHSDIIRKRKELAINNNELNKTTCEICSRIFPTVEECKNHRAKLHLLQNNPNLKKLCPLCAVFINVKDISSHLRYHYTEANKDITLLKLTKALLMQELNSILKDEESKLTRNVPCDQRNIDTILNRQNIVRNPVAHSSTSTNIGVSSKPIAEKVVSHHTKFLSQDETLPKQQTHRIIIHKEIILHSPVVQPSLKPLISTNIEVPQKSTTEELASPQNKKGETTSEPVAKDQSEGRSENKEMESTHEIAARPKSVQQTKRITQPSSALQPLHSTNINIHSIKNVKLKDVPSDKPDKISAKENIISKREDGSDSDDCILCEPELEVIEIADDSNTVHNSASTKKRIEIRKFYCNKCGKLFGDFWKLHQHIFKSSGKHDFECANCYTKFKNYVEFSNHFTQYCTLNEVVSCEKERSSSHLKYFCEICGKGYGTLKNFVEKHCNVHPSVSLCCSLCSYQCSSFKELLDHSMIHTVIGKIDLVCQICSLHFYSEIPFKYHYYMVHSQLELIPFKCYLCGVIIMDDEDKFISHVQSHGDLTKSNRKDVTKLTCEICGEILKSVQKVEMHKSTRHSDFKLIRKQCPFCLKLIHFSGLSVHIKTHILFEHVRACLICKSTFTSHIKANRHTCIKPSVNTNKTLPPRPKPQTITSSAKPSNSPNVLMKNMQVPTNTNLALPPTPKPQTITSSAKPSNSANQLMKNLQVPTNTNLVLPATSKPQTITSLAEPSNSANLLMKNIHVPTNTNLALPPTPKPQTITSSAKPCNSANQLMKNLQVPTNTNLILPATSKPQTITSSAEPSNSANLLMKTIHVPTNTNLALPPTPKPQTITSSAKPSNSANQLMKNLQVPTNTNLVLPATSKPQTITSSAEPSNSANLLMKNTQVRTNTNLALPPTPKPHTITSSSKPSNSANQLMKNLQVPTNTNLVLPATSKPQTIPSSAEPSNSANLLMKNTQVRTNTNLALPPTPKPHTITSSSKPSNSANQLMKNLQLPTNTNLALPPTPKPQTITSSAKPCNSANQLMKNLQVPTNTNLILPATSKPQTITSSAEPSNSANLLMKTIHVPTNTNLALPPTPKPQTITSSAKPSNSANQLMKNLQVPTNTNLVLPATSKPQTITSSAEPSNSANLLMKNIPVPTNTNLALPPIPKPQTITSLAKPSNSPNLLMKNIQVPTNTNLTLPPTPKPQTITSSAKPSNSPNLLMKNIPVPTNTNLALPPTPKPQTITSSAEPSNSANLLMKNIQVPINTNLALPPTPKPQTITPSAESSNSVNKLMKNLQLPINTNSALPSGPQAVTASGLSYKRTFTGYIKCQECNNHFESMSALKDHMKEH